MRAKRQRVGGFTLPAWVCVVACGGSGDTNSTVAARDSAGIRIVEHSVESLAGVAQLQIADVAELAIENREGRSELPVVPRAGCHSQPIRRFFGLERWKRPGAGV